MAKAPLAEMTLGEIEKYVTNLEHENDRLRRKTNNTKKLDKRDAHRMRKLYATGNWTQQELADTFDTSRGNVSHILNGDYYPEA